MDKTFSPAAIEAQWYAEWESKNYFAPGDGDGAYCIPIPPPNVTGTLHMGQVPASHHGRPDSLQPHER